MLTVSALIATTRPAFLVLGFACLSLPVAFAYHFQYALSPLFIALICIGTLSAHIAVNMLNEYADFRSGLDFSTEKTPFSGGSGALISSPHAATMVLGFAILALLVCCAIGVYLSALLGVQLLTIGALGVAIIVSYTPWLNRLPFLCLIAPGLAFGILVINGSYFVLSSQFNAAVISVSMIVALQVNNLLLLNQLPDINADEQSGRKHFAIKYGTPAALTAYTSMAILSLIMLLQSIYLNYLPVASLLAALPIGVSIYIGFSLRRGLQKPVQSRTSSTAPNAAQKGYLQHAFLLPYLAKNVMITLISPIIISATLVLAN